MAALSRIARAPLDCGLHPYTHPVDKFVYTARFIVALASALLAAALVQLAFSASTFTMGSDSGDILTIMLLLVVLNLATVVAFVIAQTRVLSWLMHIPRQPIMVMSTICGPVAAMGGYILGVQVASMNWALTAAPFLIGQAVLWLRLRRTVDSNKLPSEESSHLTP